MTHLRFITRIGFNVEWENYGVFGIEDNWNGTKAKGGKSIQTPGMDVTTGIDIEYDSPKLGWDNLNASGGLEGNVGNAEAYLCFAAQSDGVGFRAGAEAAVFSGETDTNFNLFGKQKKLNDIGEFNFVFQ